VLTEHVCTSQHTTSQGTAFTVQQTDAPERYRRPRDNTRPTARQGNINSSSSSLFGMHHQCVAPLAANSLHYTIIHLFVIAEYCCWLSADVSAVVHAVSRRKALTLGRWDATAAAWAQRRWQRLVTLVTAW